LGRWLCLLRGIFTLILAALIFAWPKIMPAQPIALYGAYAAADGAIALVVAGAGLTKPLPSWWLVAVALFGIAAGLATFANPAQPSLLAVVAIGVWAVARGSFDVIGALASDDIETSPLLLRLSGLAIVALVVAVIASSAGLGEDLTWVAGASALLLGSALVAQAVKAGRQQSRADEDAAVAWKNGAADDDAIGPRSNRL